MEVTKRVRKKFKKKNLEQGRMKDIRPLYMKIKTIQESRLTELGKMWGEKKKRV